MQIAIIDLGIGNLRSVEQAFSTVAPDANVIVTSDASAIVDSDRVVLPGQGAIGTWFNALRGHGLEGAVKNCLANKPMLGICVGMQALFEHCEEDNGVKGLGLFKGSVRHFRNFHTKPGDSGSSPRLKIPQMGWNQVSQSESHPLWHGIKDQAYFYFVHSYCANRSAEFTAGSDSSDVVFGRADYGHEFIAAVGGDNVFAVQFHPEKSHDDGLRLLKNFTQWNLAS